MRITTACDLPSAPEMPELETARQLDAGQLEIGKKDARLLLGYLYRVKAWVSQASKCARASDGADAGPG